MRKPLLDRVTVTGVDDSIWPFDLIAVTRDYPFVEWGMLLSKNYTNHTTGAQRFPSLEWVKLILATSSLCKLRLSAHVCGRWVRDICSGGDELLKDLGTDLLSQFDRMQLNFHAMPHKADIDAMAARLTLYHKLGIRQFILQLDGVNDMMLAPLRQRGLDVVGLYDLSGGAGILPGEWKKVADGYCGYAGGLSPENVAGELERIAAIETYPIWIDAETHLRSKGGTQFDLEKVRAFLEQAKNFYKGGD